MGKLRILVLTSVVGAGVVPACSQPATPPRAGVPFVDGTRLQAVHYEIDGAPPYFLTWHDSELGFDCSFLTQRFLDGAVCFPSDVNQPGFATDTHLFADSGCSQPVVGSYFPGESRYFVRWPESDAGSPCGYTPSRLFRLGGVVPSGAWLYRPDDSGACIPAADLNQYPELRLVGAEIPADALVSGTLQHDAGAGRIVPITIAGSDGSVQGASAIETWVLAWDNERREMVTMSSSPPSGSRWFPAFSYSASPYFADDTCTSRAAVGIVCGDLAREATVTVSDTCGRMTTESVFAVGPQLSQPANLHYVASDANACVKDDTWPATDPAYAAFAVGAPIPLASFADAIEVHTGTAQVQVIQVASPGGPAMAAVGLFDSVSGQPCAAHPAVAAADGVVRCLPDAFVLGAVTYFADESCSVPLTFDQPSENPCGSRQTLVSRDESVTSGTWRRHIYPIGAPYIGPFYFKIPGGADCMLAGDASAAFPIFAIGPEIPAASFAPVSLVRPNQR